MACGITLTSEEVDLMENLLNREIYETRSEHRRTRNPEFRSQIERRIELQEHILKTIQQAKMRAPTLMARPCPG